MYTAESLMSTELTLNPVRLAKNVLTNIAGRMIKEYASKPKVLTNTQSRYTANVLGKIDGGNVDIFDAIRDENDARGLDASTLKALAIGGAQVALELVARNPNFGNIVTNLNPELLKNIYGFSWSDDVPYPNDA